MITIVHNVPERCFSVLLIVKRCSACSADYFSYEDKLPVLSDAAMRNIDVGSIANDYLLDTRKPQTQDNAAHVDVQAISISIQGTRKNAGPV